MIARTLVSLLQQDSPVVTTIGEFFASGGFMMWPILGCSVIVVGLSVERNIGMGRRRMLPADVENAIAAVAAGNTAAVAPQLATSKAPAARVLTAGIRRSGYPLADIERSMADQIAREGMLLRGNVRSIALMATIAPLCGLLGTVLGIARAFAATEHVGQNRAELLASGIGVALYTTIFGLMVAIPATLLAAQLQARVRRTLVRLDDALAPVVEALAAQPQKPQTAPAGAASSASAGSAGSSGHAA
jgi:biopolymer transport protein ExbB